MTTAPRSARRPAGILVAAFATISTLGSTAFAEDYIAGQNPGLQKCARAILGGYEVKGVSVFNHKFNCKGMNRLGRGQHRVHLSHAQVGPDDQLYYFFQADSKNVYKPGTLARLVAKGVSLKNLPHFKFKGMPGGPTLSADTYAGYAKFARDSRRFRSAKTQWELVPQYIMAVVIAEYGNPENRGTAPRQVGCDRPTFYVHDNFSGAAVRFGTQPDPDLHDKGGRFADSISSVCVPAGWVVRAFEHKVYKGKMLEIVGPKQYEDLKRQLGWGDRISSIAAFRR